MPSIVTLECCVICGKNFTPMHSHHTVPQCRGGKDSKQVILCSNHHNCLHAHALHVVSRLRNPNAKKKGRTFWENSEYEERAAPLVQLLVQSFLQEKSEDQTHLVSFQIDSAHKRLLVQLARDLGCSIEKAALYATLQTLQKRYAHEYETESRNALWFLPAPGLRKGPTS